VTWQYGKFRKGYAHIGVEAWFEQENANEGGPGQKGCRTFSLPVQGRRSRLEGARQGRAARSSSPPARAEETRKARG
jgi:hypothetical protein